MMHLTWWIVRFPFLFPCFSLMTSYKTMKLDTENTQLQMFIVEGYNVVFFESAPPLLSDVARESRGDTFIRRCRWTARLSAAPRYVCQRACRVVWESRPTHRSAQCPFQMTTMLFTAPNKTCLMVPPHDLKSRDQHIRGYSQHFLALFSYLREIKCEICDSGCFVLS